jgi:hypothetical protein
MRWRNRRRHPVFPETKARHSDRQPSRPSESVIFFPKFGRQFRRSIPDTRKNPVAIYPVFLRSLVNYFTYRADRRRMRWMPATAGVTDGLPRVPNRTIRRVHVSPWASTVRIITRIRSGNSGGDDDGLNGGRLRRWRRAYI